MELFHQFRWAILKFFQTAPIKYTMINVQFSTSLTVDMKYALIEYAKCSQKGLTMTCEFNYFIDLDDMKRKKI